MNEQTNVKRLLSLTLWSLAIMGASGCGRKSSSEAEFALEKQISEKLNSSNNSVDGVLTIADLGHLKPGQICFQTPYMSKVDFQTVVARSITSFEEINDDVNVWWIFFSDGDVLRATVHRTMIMDRNSASKIACGDEVYITGSKQNRHYELRMK